jgi:hypothetical protein
LHCTAKDLNGPSGICAVAEMSPRESAIALTEFDSFCNLLHLLREPARSSGQRLCLF